MMIIFVEHHMRGYRGTACAVTQVSVHL